MGITIGVIVGVIIVLVLALVFMRRRRRDQRPQAPNDWHGNADQRAAAKSAAVQKAEAERAFWLAQYVAEVFMVPPTITAEMTQKVKSSVRTLIPDDTLFEEYYPEVVLSYATGRRGQDCPGAGPGMYYAAGLVKIFHECGLQCFSGLHVPVGVDWKVFMLRLKGRHANAKVLIVLKTKALYESEPCLKELNCAIERKIPLIPIVFEEGLPGPKMQWTKLTDQNSEIMIANVQEHLGKINDIPNPGTLLTAPSTLDEIIKEINKRVAIKAREAQPAVVTAGTESKPTAAEGSATTDNERGELMTVEGPVNSHHDQGSTELTACFAVPVPVNVLNFKHTFTEQRLGLKLKADPQGRIVITGCAPDAPSASKSIPTGAFLEKVNGVSTAKKSMQEVTTMLVEGKRPITLEISSAEPAVETQSQSVLVPSLPDLKIPIATEAPNPTLGQRHAIGSSVYVKRSSGEETLAYVKEYDAEKSLYTVEIERVGSGKTKTCRDKDLRESNMIAGLFHSARTLFTQKAAQESEPAEEAAQAVEEAARAAAEETAQAAEAARAAAEEAAQAAVAASVAA